MPERGIDSPPMLDFIPITEFIIPRQAFCNRYITVVSACGQFRILGFPICVHDEKYQRNEFIFNFGIIIDAHADAVVYEPVVRRLATTFTEMEVQGQFLSTERKDSKDTGRRSIGAVLEVIREDLNNYNECMIPIDSSNTINMKLFPTQPDPPPVKSWHVPIAKIRLLDIVDDRWDLTMRKVIPMIDGISDVRRIAWRADVSLELTKEALRHLLYYRTIMLVDIFFYSNVYALTPLVREFMANTDGMQDECAAYVFTTVNHPRDAGYYLCRLFASFCQGRTVKEWLNLHLDEGMDILDGLDVRRLVQFGVIKSILRRVHKFPVSSQYLASLVTGESRPRAVDEGEGDSLQKYTDGIHHFDQIITEKNMTEPEIMRELSMLPKGDVQILYR